MEHGAIVNEFTAATGWGAPRRRGGDVRTSVRQRCHGPSADASNRTSTPTAWWPGYSHHLAASLDESDAAALVLERPPLVVDKISPAAALALLLALWDGRFRHIDDDEVAARESATG